MSDFEAMVDELYRLPPSQFVQVRTDLGATVRAAGDPATAAAIAKLRKPTVSAWLLNVLAAESPDLIAGAIAIGPALREATASRDGSAIRDLSTHRRRLLGDVVAQAREIAQEHGQAFTAEHERDIEASVTAAFTDEDAAAALQSRRLTAPLSLDDHGFGAVAYDQVLAAAPAAKPRRTPEPGPTPEQQAAEAERLRAVEAAEQALAEARLQDADAEAALEAAEAAVADAETAERAAAAAHQEAKAALSDARADRTAAKADATAARRAVDTALTALERLRRP